MMTLDGVAAGDAVAAGVAVAAGLTLPKGLAWPPNTEIVAVSVAGSQASMEVSSQPVCPVARVATVRVVPVRRTTSRVVPVAVWPVEVLPPSSWAGPATQTPVSSLSQCTATVESGVVSLDARSEPTAARSPTVLPVWSRTVPSSSSARVPSGLILAIPPFVAPSAVSGGEIWKWWRRVPVQSSTSTSVTSSPQTVSADGEGSDHEVRQSGGPAQGLGAGLSHTGGGLYPAG
jgi:hypothetical protein